MEISDIFKILSKRKWQIFSFTISFLLLATIFTFVQPLKYEAKSRLIIIPVIETKDPYAISKANETMANILTQSAASNLFFNQVLESEFNIEKSYFGSDAKSQTGNWEKTIAVKPVNDTGIINISIFHKNQQQALQVLNGVVYVLKTKNNLFHGENFPVDIRVLNSPEVSGLPVKPNIFLNYILALIVGLIFSSIYVYLATESSGVAPMINAKAKIGEPAFKIATGGFSSGLNLGQADQARQALFARHNEPSQAYNELSGSRIYYQTQNSQSVRANNTSSGQGDELDLDYIMKNGSMANIFGDSKMENR